MCGNIFKGPLRDALVLQHFFVHFFFTLLVVLFFFLFNPQLRRRFAAGLLPHTYTSKQHVACTSQGTHKFEVTWSTSSTKLLVLN